MPFDDFYADAERPRGGRWIKLKEAGDRLVGELVSIDIREKTDPETGRPVLGRKSNKPRKEYIVTVLVDETEREGGEDDGMRIFSANESAQSAIIDAYKKAGGGDVAGARIGIQVTETAKDSFSQASYACSIKRGAAKPVTLPTSNIDELV